MKLTDLESLLNHLKTLPVPHEREANLFSVGARGHYENPVSDVLAFYLDPDGEHGLDTLTLDALLACLEEASDLASALIKPPEREVSTVAGNRIDLLLESNEWVMIIENKIGHLLNNPFDDYTAYLNDESYREKKPYYIVLSPNGRAPVGWTGVSYREFTRQLTLRLGEAFISAPLNKWLILLREYVLHLESLMINPAFPVETEEFIRENLHRIHEMVQLKNSVIKGMMEEGRRWLTAQFSRQQYEVKVTQHTWSGYPALRFSFEHWTSYSDVVLFLHGEPEEQYEVRTYTCELIDEELRERAISALNVEGCEGDYWDEGKRTIIGFRIYQPQTTKTSALFTEVAKRMLLLDRFECEQR
ncbi:PD-(D/E)XK nuclease family protein [Winslowiella sp. 2C04]|uniref:PD-(D/E)XK nuclease family protein n=1 Tax=Winslowiella sp. 2C04 TaxID=3416179 RepID=UPI003CE72F8A